MPELPEVETIASALRSGGRGAGGIIGRRITEAHLLWERTLAVPHPVVFFERILGQQIRSVGRRGKYLIIGLDADFLLFHLRMSGDIYVEPQFFSDGLPTPLRPHDRLVLEFADETRLAFNDARKFGRAWLVADPQQVIGGLGPEPFDPGFTPEVLYQRLRAHHRQIKPLLLDQSFIAGLGNIYTDEALYLSRIHPRHLSSSISFEQAVLLWDAIRSVLQEGIRRNGASFDWVYRGGEFQNSFQVYQQAGNLCRICGAVIVRTVVGQRGTHYCPNCQPE